MKGKRLLPTLCCIIYCLPMFGQFDPLRREIAKADSLNTNFSREKIFIHYDRPYYLVNDTLWMKGYILSARDLFANDSSRIAYIEVIDADGRSIKRTSTHAIWGIFFAEIVLNQTDFKQGSYLLRAWTNHMRNYGDSLFFQSRFHIINPGSLDWQPVTTLQTRNINSQEIKEKLQPQKDVKQIDLQFLPEGGSYIVGKKQRVGFKALVVFGKGTNVSGRIENSKKELVTTLQTQRNGMGKFWIEPAANEKYIAILDNGRTYELPVAKALGTILQVNNDYSTDSIEIKIDASPDRYNKEYFFRASARGITVAYGNVRLLDKVWRRALPRNAFPSGITRFTLYDSMQLPVNERVIFVMQNDTLQLQLTPNKPLFENRDSVHLQLSVKNSDTAAQGSFSVAVIDTSRVPFQQYAENILSYMLLSSDLQGNIEEPAYYIDNPGSDATDALMLTQGWVQYDRFYIKPTYGYEKEFAISGKVTNILNRPVPNSQLTLLGKDGKQQSFLSETKTGKNGEFIFDNFPPFTTDSASLLIKATNRGGRSFGIGIELSEPAWPIYRIKPKTIIKQDIVHDTAAIQFVKQENDLHKQGFGKEYLPEVVVSARMRVKGSKNLNEDGGSDQVISEKVLGTMPKENLLNVLYKEVKGFFKGTYPRSMVQTYKINGDYAVFIIDGYDINFGRSSAPGNSYTAYVEFLETYLKYINAEDIAGIEVMKSSKYSMAYERQFNYESGIMVKYIFIEVTTYSGNGAFYKKVPGMYMHKPVAPVVAKSFYSPQYSFVDTTNKLPDFRSTIYWKPDIITDKNGLADFSFYTSDSKGGYLVIVQGIDFNGKLGITFLPLYINSRPGTRKE